MSSSIRDFFKMAAISRFLRFQTQFFACSPQFYRCFGGYWINPPKIALNMIWGGGKICPPGPNVKSKYPCPDRVNNHSIYTSMYNHLQYLVLSNKHNNSLTCNIRYCLIIVPLKKCIRSTFEILIKLTFNQKHSKLPKVKPTLRELCHSLE